MGSGSKRRGSDHVLILPQKKRGTGGGSGGGQAETEMVCPLSFSVGLEDSALVGAPLQIRKKEPDGLAVYLAGRKVVELDKALAEQIGQCLGIGYHYEGIVKEKKSGRHYGEFTRTI